MGSLLNQFLLVKGCLVQEYQHQQKKQAGDVQQQIDPGMDGGNFHLLLVCLVSARWNSPEVIIIPVGDSEIMDISF
jgi:hypothetical protein